LDGELATIYFRDNLEVTKEQLEILIKQKKEDLSRLEKNGKDYHYIQELSNLALMQLEAEMYDESEANLKTCLKHFEKQPDRLGQAALFGILGTLFFKMQEYQKAIDNYSKAFEIYKVLNQFEEQIICLKGIGNSLIALNELEEAIEIFIECSAICSDKDDIYNLLECIGNLIFIYETKEDWDVLYELYIKALNGFKQLDDKMGMITSHFNLGIILKKQQNYRKAFENFKSGTKLARDANYAETIIKGLGYVGECLFYLGKVNDAKNKFIEALLMAKDIKAENAVTQLQILLNSLGLNERLIDEELKKRQERPNST